MKAAVIGGGGFIGSTLTDLLVQTGHDAVVFDDFSTGFRENLSASTPIVVGDVRDPVAVRRALVGIDVVFHLAASVGNRRSLEDPVSDAQANVIGTLNVLEATRLAGCRRIVFSSSAATYGEPESLPVNEGQAQRPMSPYGVSKLAAEKYVLTYGHLYDMGVVCLRYFNVYGPRQRFDAYGNVIPIFAKRIECGEPLRVFGNGRQTRDFVHVLDVARANLAAAESVKRGCFNVASGRGVSIEDLAHAMMDVAGRNVPIEYEEPRPGDVLHSVADTSLIGETLGFHAKVDLRAGLADYLSWLRSDGSPL